VVNVNFLHLKEIHLNLIKKIKQVDKQRAEYYKHFTNQTWGDRNNYDLCVDTAKIGVIQTIDMLENYINKRVK